MLIDLESVTDENVTTVYTEPTIYSEFVPSNRTSLVCSPYEEGVREPSEYQQEMTEMSRHSIRLWPNTTFMANIRVLTGNFSGEPSDNIEFQTAEDPVIVEETTMVFDWTTDYYDVDSDNSTDEESAVVGNTRKKYPRYRRKKFMSILVGSSMWFVVMIFSISILFIILLVVCIVKRRRGQHYSVHEKEKSRGHEPEIKEDNGFREYVKRLTKPGTKRFRKRFDRDKDSESGSLREYEDHADMMRFLEDGSFIGQYLGFMKQSEPILVSSTASIV
jgi:hypothetical protein